MAQPERLTKLTSILSAPPQREEYEVLEKIGHGSFGVIRKVRRKTDGHVLCRKEINYHRMSQKEREQLNEEFRILNSLNHPNIVGYYHREHLKVSQDVHLYMEYCGNGDLGRVIKDLKAKHQYAEEEFVWSIFAQLVTALYRCHHGVDPPPVGRNVMGSDGPEIKQPGTLTGEPKVMILHRDLKPENVFLGEDNSVKLGDFGLSKLMQSHDFASTYVGTPFYMSPEICAAARYTLHSDIWSLGCIMYELCAKEPPFNARTHFNLMQKIKAGKFSPIPNVYSPNLASVIRSCLKVDPTLRPDTAALLNLPIVKLMRKEREVVDIGRIVRSKTDLLSLRTKEFDERLLQLDAERSKLRTEVEAIVRREWELKARLEIDRRVKLETERLQGIFIAEVASEVQSALQKQLLELQSPPAQTHWSTASSKRCSADTPLSSVSTIGGSETDFPSQTDLTDLTSLSLESPISTHSKPRSGKSARTPLSRSRTTLDWSPMEIVEPSPMSIASLSLSPRRNGAVRSKLLGSTARNIFAIAAGNHNPIPRLNNLQAEEDSRHSDDDDDLPPLSSPTRQRGPSSKNNPFHSADPPPGLSKGTAPLGKPGGGPNLYAKSVRPAITGEQLRLDVQVVDADENGINKMAAMSANGRISKIPSSVGVASEMGSPIRGVLKARKTPLLPAGVVSSLGPAQGEDTIRKVAIKKNMSIGQSLVGLAQAGAGIRPVVSRPLDPAQGNRTGKRTANVERKQPWPVWDPERDEMPSPFLVRGSKVTRRL